MRSIKERIFITFRENVSLDFIVYFSENRKRDVIESVHLDRHRGLKQIFKGMSLRYYNIKQNIIKIS